MRGRTIVAAAAACLLGAVPLRSETAHYTPKNGVFSLKTLVLGGGFRVTTAVALHGDFSRFGRVEVVEAESLVGPDAPPAFLHRLTAEIADEFRKGRHFIDVVVVEDAKPPDADHVVDAPANPDEFRTADSLDAPMRGVDDLAAMNALRAAAERANARDVLVVRSQVIDVAKGNKFLQLLFMNWGNALLTLRLSCFDGATGEEIGRSVISSDNSSKVVPSLLSTRTALGGVAEGLVDQITRRKVGAER